MMIDLWAMDSPACRLALEKCDEIAARLTPESRQVILELKSQLWRHPDYRDTITAKTIYDAVLDGGVKRSRCFLGVCQVPNLTAPPASRSYPY